MKPYLALLPLLAGNAVASPYPLVYGGMGWTKPKWSQMDAISAATHQNNLAQAGLTPTGEEQGREGAFMMQGYVYSLGVEWNRYLSLDLTFKPGDDGDERHIFAYATDAAGTRDTYGQHAYVNTQGLTLFALGRLPLGEHFEVFAGVGAYRASTSVRTELCGFNCNQIVAGAWIGMDDRGFKTTSTMPAFSGGVSFTWMKNIIARLSYSKLQSKLPTSTDGTLNGIPSSVSERTLGLSLLVRFHNFDQDE